MVKNNKDFVYQKSRLDRQVKLFHFVLLDNTFKYVRRTICLSWTNVLERLSRVLGSTGYSAFACFTRRKTAWNYI